MKFIDEAIIEIQAGHGGKGCVSFRREKYVPRGGPDGGNGGRGGHVIFEATHNMSTLMDFRYKKKIQAQDGQKGMGGQCDGKSGQDMVIPVPVGTIVYDLKTNDVLVDFTGSSQREIIASGGRGGKGNAFFVTSTRQTPRFSQDGEEGEKKQVKLELKLIADVGLIGCPNAGKSTFLSVISQARPKIADYPFTTLHPCLGVVEYEDNDSFVMVDLPGLIEGAHEGKGMGDAFLKHAERTRLLLHLVSISPEEKEDPIQRYKTIKNEVMSYYNQTEMLAKKSKKSDDTKRVNEMVVLSKTDLLDDKTVNKYVDEFKKKLGVDVFLVSSVTGKNLGAVLSEVLKRLKR